MTEKQKKRIRRRTIEIRRAISAMNYVSSGTLHVRTKVCGRPNCRCAADPAYRHGPYYEWSRSIDGRIVHKILSERQADLVTQAISNYREVLRLLSLWEGETTEEILTVNEPPNHRTPS